MGAFHHPSARFLSGFAFKFAGLFPAASDVRGEAEFRGEVAYLLIVVASVETEPLWRVGGGFGTVDDDALQRGAGELHVGSVRAVNLDADGNSRRFSQEASFHAVFGAVDGTGSGFSPRQAAPW